MSKARTAFFTVLLVMGLLADNAFSQGIKATLKIDEIRAAVAVSGSVQSRERSLSFLRSSIGVSGLADRISEVSLKDKSGKPLSYKRSETGDVTADSDFAAWQYSVSLAAHKNPRAAAHVSWMDGNVGVLMLDDLFPHVSGSDGVTKTQSERSADIMLELPAGWTVATSEDRTGPASFAVKNIEKAVFVIGRDMRVRPLNVGGTMLNVVVAGQWLFSDAESTAIAEEVCREYSKIFNAGPAGNLQIAILPFPQKDLQKGTWEAETRGRSVTIVSADMAFKTQSLQRLHEQMRHEIFHLWIPNGVNLTGNYDWFYEGFALYQSLKTGVALNQIRFDDLLDTLSRAHNIDTMQTRRLSLIEASQNRWNGADTQVYARGMLAAFLCDLELLKSSKGKRSADDIFRELFNSHRPSDPPSEANTAILKILGTQKSLDRIVESYIKGQQKIDWQAELDTAGIENEPGNSRTSLRVKPKLNGTQKALLDKLGYNNWRKLARKS